MKQKMTEQYGDEDEDLTPEEAKDVLDANIRRKFRWAIARSDGDVGNAGNFDDDRLAMIVQDIYDDVVSEMRHDAVVRAAVRDGVRKFSTAYVTGVITKAIKNKTVPNPGILVSAAQAVDELDEGGMPPWLKKKVADKKDEPKKGKKGGAKKKGLPPAFVKQMGKG